MITKTANRTLLAVSGTTYDFTFRIDSEDELEVYGIAADGSSTLLLAGFTISFVPENENGTVTFNTEPSTYSKILMLRNKDYKQSIDIPIRAGFNENDIEQALDNVVMLIQQLKEITDYCIKADLTSEANNFELPTPDAGKAIVWNATEDGLENSEIDLVALQTAVDDVDAAVTAAQAAQTAAEAAQALAEAAQAAAQAAAAAFTAASQAEAEAGVENTKFMTALRVKQAITAQTVAQVGLGDWAAKANNTVYQAATDGFVVATVTGSGTNCVGYTDTNNPPTTARITSYNTGNYNLSPIMFPVKKGHYWKVTGANDVQWIPLGS